MQQPPMLDWSYLDNDELYDREPEQAKLFAAYHKRLSSESCNEFILLSGKSGTGKTTLAQTIRRHVASEGGFFVSGKFDQLQKSEPYAALVSAFTEYVTLLMNDPDSTHLQQVKRGMRTSLRADLQVLTDMIPAFEQIVGLQHASSSVRGTKATQRLNLATRNLVRTICSTTKPLVLFLDDLQWADPGTLDLLRVLASDKTCDGLVLIGACRYNEVEFEDEFAHFLRTIEKNNQATIVPIELHNLTYEAVEDFVSDALNVPKEESRPLFRAVYRKTKGNILFVVQALESLWKNNILIKDNTNGRWQWDTRELKAWGEGVNNVVELMVHKIRSLSSDVQTVLMMAACLGSEFDEYILVEIVSELDASSAVDEAIDNGLLVELRGGGFYRFAHDRVQQAAYSLHPQSKAATMHLDIGRRLRTKLSEEDIEMHIFLVVDQMKRGHSLLDDQDEKDELAKLCLQAGRKATKCSDFKAAAKHFTLGIDSLSQRNWLDQYYLSLDLHNAVAEAKYCTADFEEMDKYINDVFLNARSLRDKIPAYSTKIYALGARVQLKEACNIGLSLLEELGEKINPEASRYRVMLDVAKTRRMLRKKSDTFIMDQPPMCDPDKIAAMSILNLLVLYAWNAKFEIFPLIPCRMVQLTIKHGPCAVSAFGFATYGVLMSIMDRAEETRRSSGLSLTLLEKYKIVEWVPRVYLVNYGMIQYLIQPLRDFKELFQHGHQVGLETGDVEISMVASHVLLIHGFLVGKQLKEIEKDSVPILNLMVEYKQDHILGLAKVEVQAVHNLLGRSKNVCILTGDIITDQEKMLEEFKKNDNNAAVCRIAVWRMVIAYIMNDYKLAVDMAGKSRPLRMRQGLIVFVQYFYDGLSSIAWCQESPKEQKKHYANARTALVFLKKVSHSCPRNVMNKIFLLEAEINALKGKLDLAVPMYQRSIELAKAEGFLQEQAFANERAGLALRHCGDVGASVSFLQEAYDLYEKWGATVKTEQMTKNFSLTRQIGSKHDIQ